MNRNAETRTLWLIRLGLVLGTLGGYLRILGNDFVRYDDGGYVYQNARVLAGLSLEGFFWAMTSMQYANWHPLAWLSHMLDCDLFGLAAAGHHLSSLLIHTAGTLALFGALRRLTGAVWRPALVAALFGWHPAHVESVAWVAERKDVLCALGGFLTLGAYCRYVRAGDTPAAGRLYGWCLFWFALGLMAKPMLVTLPFVLLLLDYWPLRRISDWGLALPAPSNPGAGAVPSAPVAPQPLLLLVREKLPFFALTVLSSILTFIAQHSAGAVASITRLPLGQRVGNVILSYARYVGELFWPAKLAVFYPMLQPLPVFALVLSCLLLAGLTLAVLLARRERPYLLVGWFWFVGTLVPVIGLVQVGGQSMADRYTYIPSVGIFLMVAWGLEEWTAARPQARRFTQAGLAAALAICLLLTWRQTAYWYNTFTLFSHARDVTPPNFVAEDNLAAIMTDRGDFAAALLHVEAAARIEPKSAGPMASRARIYNLQGDPVRAREMYERALQADPRFGDVHYNLANLLLAQNDLTGATNHYALALQENPDLPDARFNLGMALLRQGALAAAADQFKAALVLNPNYLEAYTQLAGIWMRRGVPEAAELNYREALRVKPDFALAHLKLGYLLARSGKIPEATQHLGEAVRLDPTNALAHYNLGAALAAGGHWDPAREQYVEAGRLDPADAETPTRLADVLGHLGRTNESLTATRKAAGLLLQQGRFEDAITVCREGLKLKSDSPEVLANLAWLLAASPVPAARRGPEAVELAERACRLGDPADARLLTSRDAAYAEAGRFPDAIRAAEETLAAARRANLTNLVDATTRRLELYRSGQAFRLAAPASAAPATNAAPARP